MCLYPRAAWLEHQQHGCFISSIMYCIYCLFVFSPPVVFVSLFGNCQIECLESNDTKGRNIQLRSRNISPPQAASHPPRSVPQSRNTTVCIVCCICVVINEIAFYSVTSHRIFQGLWLSYLLPLEYLGKGPLRPYQPPSSPRIPCVAAHDNHASATAYGGHLARLDGEPYPREGRRV